MKFVLALQEFKNKEVKFLSDKNLKSMTSLLVESEKLDDHKCGTCFMRTKGDGDRVPCTIVEKMPGISKSKGTCGFWAEGEASDKSEISETRIQPETAGYVEVEPDLKIQCGTCRHFQKLDKDGHCTLWSGKVKTIWCCMVWEQQ